MDAEPRREKKAAEALRLRGIPPERTIRMGFQLMEFTRRLQKAAEHARR